MGCRRPLGLRDWRVVGGPEPGIALPDSRPQTQRTSLHLGLLICERGILHCTGPAPSGFVEMKWDRVSKAPNPVPGED